MPSRGAESEIRQEGLFERKNVDPAGSVRSRDRDAELARAHGGCLGTKSRCRTWMAAISLGEPPAGCDPGISEWGNPTWVMPGDPLLNP